MVAEFIDKQPPSVTVIKSEELKATHVRESQYFLQIVKCCDVACCMSFHSSYLKVVPDRFLPPPLPVVQGNNGIEWAKKDEEDAKCLSLYQNSALHSTLMPNNIKKKYPNGIPYDLSCPSVKMEIQKRLCSSCGI